MRRGNWGLTPRLPRPRPLVDGRCRSRASAVGTRLLCAARYAHRRAARDLSPIWPTMEAHRGARRARHHHVLSRAWACRSMRRRVGRHPRLPSAPRYVESGAEARCPTISAPLADRDGVTAAARTPAPRRRLEARVLRRRSPCPVAARAHHLAVANRPDVRLASFIQALASPDRSAMCDNLHTRTRPRPFAQTPRREGSSRWACSFRRGARTSRLSIHH